MPYALRSLLFALCSLPFALFAQYFTIGTDPASVKWNQVKTAHFKIIYPENLDTEALYMANAMEYIRIPESASLGGLPGKWPVIVHTRTVISNALTPYAPKRIELMTNPPQDIYAQDWTDQLLLHEFRHAVQYATVNRGLTKALTYLFGQQVVPAVLGIFVPFWLIEGDAVSSETALCPSGRGRVPSFEMKLRAQFLEKGIYSYDKAVNGSFRDFTPDRYELGYQLAGRTRVKYGKETWSRAIKKTGNIPLMLVPFSNTLYRETGSGKSRLYNEISSGLKEEWRSEDENISLSSFKSIGNSSYKFYTNLTQPSVLPGGKIAARKSSIDDLPRIILIDTAGHESNLLAPGYMIDEGLSAAGQYICWAEEKRDPRWDLRTYSVIMIHDMQSGRTRQITCKSRYFSPDLSRDGKTIAAAETDETDHFFLVILDAETGEVIHRFPTPDSFPGYPAWSPDSKKVALILTSDKGKSLVLANAVTGNFEILLPFSFTEISKPVFFRQYILFTGAYTGMDNIFAFDTASKKLYQVTSSRFGATDAAVDPDGSRLYYSDYHSSGYEIALAKPGPDQWKEFDPDSTYRFELADKLAEQENFTFRQSDVPDSAYEIKPYRKGLNLFNFHSWEPLAVNIDNTNVNPGVTLLSQNLLSTSYTTLGYEYNLNEETGKYFLKYSYEGLYPAFDLGFDYGMRKDLYVDTLGKETDFKFHELNLSGGIRVPLNWYVKSWFLGVQPSAAYSYKFLKMEPGTDLHFVKDRINSLGYRLFFYAQSRQSERDLNPAWGQTVEINYKNTPFEGDSVNSIFSAELLLYFPGLFRHHSFKVYGGYQDRRDFDYYYSGLISLPKGYSGIYANRIFSGQVSYEFPIFCPDWHIGPVIYIKRLKAAVFYDKAFELDTGQYRDDQSAGVDLTLDFHLFRSFVPVEAGLRTIYLPESGKMVFEFLYRINLSSVY